MVFYNKYLLSYYGFYYPITLTLWHMVFCSGVAAACMAFKVAQPLDIPTELYVKKILPIAACYAGALWSSNEAYAVCSVSFAQMVKAGMPVTVFFTGLVFGTEKFKVPLLANIIVITVGVGISAYGEAHLVVKGLILIILSMTLDATRLTLTQQLMQSSGLRFNPLTTLYYIAPPASAFLAIPFVILEVKGASNFLSTATGLWHFLLNASNAFGLNLAVYLLIGRTSALTMNICGLIKDWFTISASVAIFHTTVTVTNLGGYIIAFVGVIWYNYLRMPRPVPANQSAENAEEKEPLKGSNSDSSNGDDSKYKVVAASDGKGNHFGLPVSVKPS